MSNTIWTADDLNNKGTVTVEGVTYVVYSDGEYTFAVTETAWDAHADTEYDNTDSGGYTAWCQDVRVVANEDLGRRIAIEAGLSRIWVGSCNLVEVADAEV